MGFGFGGGFVNSVCICSGSGCGWKIFISVGVLGLVVGSGPSDMGDCLIWAVRFTVHLTRGIFCDSIRGLWLLLQHLT